MEHDKFWEILSLLDWANEGDDEAVIAPVTEYLSRQPDEAIFAFDEIMAKLLYDIDGMEWARDVFGDSGYISPDYFLYARCVAIVNGKAYYEAVKNRTEKLPDDGDFESYLVLRVGRGR